MSEKNPWKTLSSKIVYENPWIRVREDDVITPGGSSGIYGVVETRIAVGIIPVFDDLSTILVGQFRYPNQVYSWEIVEGGNDPGEDPLETARREMEEETGLRVKSIDNIQELGGLIHLSNSHSSEVGHIYIARNLISGTPRPESTEVLDTKRVPITEALSLVENGSITDGLSIIGLYRVARHLKLI